MPPLFAMLKAGPLEWAIFLGILLYCATRGFFDAKKSIYASSHAREPIRVIFVLLLLLTVFAVLRGMANGESGGIVDVVFNLGFFVVLTVVIVWPTCALGYYVAHQVASRLVLRQSKEREEAIAHDPQQRGGTGREV